MTIFIKNKHTLQIDEFKFRCCIGKKGSTKNKKEGDKKTPKGTFKIENLYFRKDRNMKPLTSLKCIEIKKNMGWCNDIRFPNKYNKLIKIEKLASESVPYIPIWVDSQKAWSQISISRPVFNGSGIISLSDLEIINE